MSKKSTSYHIMTRFKIIGGVRSINPPTFSSLRYIWQDTVNPSVFYISWDDGTHRKNGDEIHNTKLQDVNDKQIITSYDVSNGYATYKGATWDISHINEVKFLQPNKPWAELFGIMNIF